jgi:excinuclease ABC subunit C
MEQFKYLKKDEFAQLPKTAGVYAFSDNRKLLYIGKATNIKERVKNHFHPVKYREAVISLKAKLFNRVKQIGYILTDSEIEALLLESQLIKKHQPKYNVMWRDDKNYFFVGITKDYNPPTASSRSSLRSERAPDLPRVFITHQPKPEARSTKYEKTKKRIFGTSYFRLHTSYIGPFVEGNAIKKTLRILRKIFPYYTIKKHPKVPCSWCHLGLCPGPSPNKKEYKKNIKNLAAVLKGKKQSVLRNLKKEMKAASVSQDFEKAAKIRDQIESLERVLAHARIFETKRGLRDTWSVIQKTLQKILKTKRTISRIEAYDVSNIQGQEATGSMITFIKGQPDKNFYRKFRIRITGKPNDTAMIKEVLSRRFQHPEWPYPDLILIDGGIGQLSAALKIKNKRLKIKNIKVTALAKKENKLFIEGRKKPILLKTLPRGIFNLILQLRDEAHRFALTYHLKLREVDLLGNF